ncbi:uncharacterized protein LOC131618997 [Vicia villosa]|uniref:uncharacterized protein LOC131618997 n=1 Tax=Vicia villosa TaxID=3911 RepID=UPI00273CEF69|nr:uncharacterized protein LOC131618997 [Vicia villosa]
MANNNTPSPDPFVLEQLIEDSSRELTNRRRQERVFTGQRQQIQHIQHVHGLQQVQNVEQAHPEGQVQNGEDGQTRPQTEPDQLQVVNETDTRDGQHASSFTHTSDRRRSRSRDEEEQINVPEGADPTAILLLKELQKTNRLIRQQGDRIHDLERNRRYRSPRRRRHRSRSYSSSRSPPRRSRKRSPSRSRSPSRRNRRQRSYSRSPPRKTRKNQKPETTEAKSLSPEQEHRGPSKAVQKVREHSPKDNRKISGKPRTKPQRGRHSNSPEPSDEEDFRSPLSEQIRRVRLPRGMEKPPALDHYDGTTDPDDHIRSIEAVMDYHVYESRKALKAQALADFVAEMTSIADSPNATKDKWTIYVDGASSRSGSGAGIILENGEGLIIEVSLVLSFNTSNNQAEYEALLAGLRLAEDIGAREVKVYTDSQLVASHISGEYQAKNDYTTSSQKTNYPPTRKKPQQLRGERAHTLSSKTSYTDEVSPSPSLNASTPRKH